MVNYLALVAFEARNAALDALNSARHRFVRWLLDGAHVSNVHFGENSISVSPGASDVLRWSGTQAALVEGDVGMNVTSGRISMFVGGSARDVAHVDELSAGGSVSGPLSSTDTALVRWDGVDGDALLDSGILVDASDNIGMPANATLDLNGTGGRVNFSGAGSASWMGAEGSINNITVHGDDVFVENSGGTTYVTFNGGTRTTTFDGGGTTAIEVDNGDVNLDDGERLQWGGNDRISNGETSRMELRSRGNGTGTTGDIRFSMGLSANTIDFTEEGDAVLGNLAFIYWNTHGGRTYIQGDAGAGTTEFAADDLLNLRPDNDLIVSPNGTEAMRVDANLNVSVGTGALATTATDGFLYIPTSAGPPTGTPTAKAGLVPVHYDSTNDRLYVYNGAWVSVALA